MQRYFTPSDVVKIFGLKLHLAPEPLVRVSTTWA
jgi:hypothetical protein